MKFIADRPFAGPEPAARRLADFANATEAVQDGRICIELINAHFLKAGGTPDQFRAALARATEKGWFDGTYVRFTQTGADLFA